MTFQRVFTVAMVALTAFSFASAITMEEIISRNIEARGGVAKIKALSSVKTTGTMSTQGGEIAFTQCLKDNKKFRMDMTIQGMNIIQAFDGTVAWGSNPMGGNKPEKSSPESAKKMAERADWEGEFIDTEKKGYKLELMGAEDLEGSTVYKVKITNKDGDSRFTYIDATTWLVIKEDTQLDMGGQNIDVSMYYTNYQEIHGVQVPMQIDVKYQGQDAMSMTFEKIEIVADLPDSMFAFPESK